MCHGQSNSTHRVIRIYFSYDCRVEYRTPVWVSTEEKHSDLVITTEEPSISIKYNGTLFWRKVNNIETKCWWKITCIQASSLHNWIMKIAQIWLTPLYILAIFIFQLCSESLSELTELTASSDGGIQTDTRQPPPCSISSIECWPDDGSTQIQSRPVIHYTNSRYWPFPTKHRPVWLQRVVCFCCIFLNNLTGVCVWWIGSSKAPRGTEPNLLLSPIAWE